MRSRTLRSLAAAVALALIVVSCSSPDDDTDTATSTTEAARRGGPGSDDAPDPVIDDDIRIEVLSSQPDRATGPDARIRVSPAEGGSAEDLAVTLGDHDVTGQLEVVDGALEGVVVGLVEGNNTVRAAARSAPDDVATQRIRSWPLSGPMISGPQIPLLACSTVQHGLGEPTDDDCSAPTRVTWSYVGHDGQLRPLDPPSARPADLAEVAVAGPDGHERTVPFIVRRERGVLNRSVYDIVTIDPSPEGPDADQGDAAWNGRLLYRFGGGCGSTHGQGVSATDPAAVVLLAEGYAVATATFNTSGVQCNDVISAETAMMVKERFIELFGPPDHTIADGASGGAVQIHLIAQNYPGLIDGAVTLEGFPDFVTTFGGATDCGLLQRWYADGVGARLTPEQRAAVNGHATAATCANWEEGFAGLLDPTSGCDVAVDPVAVYHPVGNPSGIRCTYQDEAVNVFGTDPTTGFANRPLDNVGVQYGLEALNDGEIGFEQFLDLNREIGGYDIDGDHQAQRHEAAPEAVAVAYETGRISTAAGDQTKIPVVAIEVWNDPSGSIHDRFRPFSLRDRLTQGRSPAAAPGFQIWTREPTSVDDGAEQATSATALGDALAAVDEWLSDLDGAPRGADRSESLEASRPARAIDNCLVPGRDEPVTGLHVYDEDSACRDRYPLSGDPRTAAGAPRSNDVVKCMLKSVDPADYEEAITTDQYEQLLEIFPVGVCDWSSRGVGQTSPSMTDRSFDDVVTPEQMA